MKIIINIENDRPIVLMGGVASSGLLKEMITERLNRKRIDRKILFSDPALSSDNAVGIALYGLEQYLASGHELFRS